jgi:Ni2+-binding GTPase involved in maturation of urease and hydrogenase
MTAGPTSSGKTVLIRRILKHHKSLIYLKNESIDILKVIWAYGQWQNLYEEQIPDVEIRYVEGLPSEEEI